MALALAAPGHSCSLHDAKSVVRQTYRQTAPLTPRDARRIARRTRCLERSDRSDLHIFRNRMRAWRRAHAQLIRDRRAWRYFRAHPMPWCTWGPESGASLAEYHPARYRARNPSSTAGGKYQILDGTWRANGGRHYHDSHPAAVAPPLEQERVARRVLRSQGLGAWVNC